MAKNVGYINPNPTTNLRHEMAQGADVGDTGYGPDGTLYRWSGAAWESSGGGGGGGGGGVGRIHLDYKTSYSGTTSPTLDARQDLTLSPISSGFLAFL